MSNTMSSASPGQIRIQVHTDAIPLQQLVSLKSECENLAEKLVGALAVRFEDGEDEGKYLNIIFGTWACEDLWPQIDAALYQSVAHGPTLRAQSMALCTGNDGWNDYVLLYHFDPGVPVEQAQ